MRRLKTYRVTFVQTSHMRIELRAPSPEAAIAKAEHLYLEVDSNDPRFECFGGDAFADAYAEEAQP